MKIISGKDTVKNEIPDILFDESRFTLGTPEKVFYPETPADISEILKRAQKDKRTVTLIGGQTGITGGSVPTDGCYAACFSCMDTILRVESNDNNAPVLFCQPGITLNQIAEFTEHPESRTCTIKGSDILKKEKWFYPPDPTEMTAQLGGTVATNASGARSFKFGPTRPHIESLSLVLASGETVTVKRSKDFSRHGTAYITTDQGTKIVIPRMNYTSPEIKNASGYFSAPGMELIDLFIGSEGTLAVFSELGIRLSPKPQCIGALSFFPTPKESLQFAGFLRKQNVIAAIEYFDKTALDLVNAGKQSISLKIPGFPERSGSAVYWEFIESDDASFMDTLDMWDSLLSHCCSSLESTWIGLDTNKQEVLKNFRHAVPELVNAKIAECKKSCSDIRKVGTDAAIPSDQFEKVFDMFKDSIQKNNLQSVIFGHLGEYHLHFNIIPHTHKELTKALAVYDEMMEIVISNGGSISAEHGIGKIKVAYLEKMYGKKIIEEMKKIKIILDPQSLLNPGNLFK